MDSNIRYKPEETENKYLSDVEEYGSLADEGELNNDRKPNTVHSRSQRPSRP